jgi:hypothetical protein
MVAGEGVFIGTDASLRVAGKVDIQAGDIIEIIGRPGRFRVEGISDVRTLSGRLRAVEGQLVRYRPGESINV